MAVPQDAPASRTIPGEMEAHYEFAPNCIEIRACGGSGEEAEAARAERLTDAEVMDEVDHYRGQADTAIMYQPA